MSVLKKFTKKENLLPFEDKTQPLERIFQIFESNVKDRLQADYK